ncbi:MAG: cytidine deaminase, partial [Cyclobacteriaceae bacterium]
MKEREFKVSYTILSIDEINETQLQAIEVARKAVKTAYSPYSNYQVGAAILLENHNIVPGNNQENAVYPLGLCAERVAL